jgi:PleD family two-component response regulator
MNTDANSSPEIETGNRAMVLLVDDHPMVGEAIRRMLRHEAQIDFHFCLNPPEAINVANQIRPTVILQDLVLLDISGLELLRHFRANPQTKDTPIIVLSSEEDALFKRDAFAFGANDYLVKLPDNLELIARVQYHSRAYLNLLQRDEAYRALGVSRQELLNSNTKLMSLNQELQAALAQVTQLHGLFPICSYCKKIRDDQNYWEQIESYITKHSGAQFSHGICPECFDRYAKPDLKEIEEAIKKRAQQRPAPGLAEKVL